MKDEQFDRWLQLRALLKEAKKKKDYLEIINAAENIIQLDKVAKHIRIMTPIFYKEIGEAYYKLGNIERSYIFLQQSITGFKDYRLTHQLNKPDDWIKEITVLTRKVMKIEKEI
jgi:tetratricopeptide (TPR) repeat protein